MRTVLCSFPVRVPDDIPNGEVIRLVGHMIDVGLSDFSDVADDDELDEDMRLEAKQAVSLEIGEGSATAFDPPFYCQNCGHEDTESAFIPSDGNPAPHVCPQCGSSSECFPKD